MRMKRWKGCVVCFSALFGALRCALSNDSQLSLGIRMGRMLVLMWQCPSAAETAKTCSAFSENAFIKHIWRLHWTTIHPNRLHPSWTCKRVLAGGVHPSCAWKIRNPSSPRKTEKRVWKNWKRGIKSWQGAVNGLVKHLFVSVHGYVGAGWPLSCCFQKQSIKSSVTYSIYHSRSGFFISVSITFPVFPSSSAANLALTSSLAVDKNAHEGFLEMSLFEFPSNFWPSAITLTVEINPMRSCWLHMHMPPPKWVWVLGYTLLKSSAWSFRPKFDFPQSSGA